MDEVILRFLQGRATRAEEEHLTAWLRESTDHEVRMDSLKKTLSVAWSRDQRIETGEPPSAEDLIRKSGRGARSGSTPGHVRVRSPAFVPLALAAAGAFLALGLAGYGWWTADGDRLVAEELTTGAGESTTIRLSDGSVVRLGPESRFQVMESGSAREVVLVGRAFFAVAAHEAGPFRVHTPSGNIRVLGTRFQIEADVDDMRLVVVEGTVALASSGSEVQVKAGQMARVRSGRAEPIQQAPGMGKLSSGWMGQFLVFQATPLTQVAEEVQELYGVEVRILDAALGAKTLTMWFSSRPLEDVLKVVCSVVDADCEIDGGVVSIAPKSS